MKAAFEVAPADLGRAEKPFWATAYRNYNPDEYRVMRAAGADSVRIQIAQVGADPRSPKFDRAFLVKFSGLKFHQNGYGFGAMVDIWYRTSVPPASAE